MGQQYAGGIQELAERAPRPRRHSGGGVSHTWRIAGYPGYGTPDEHVLYQCGCGQLLARTRRQLSRASREERQS